MTVDGDGEPVNGLKSLTLAEALAVAKSMGKLSTGSDGLDMLLSGGYGEGRITEVFGASNSGKTQLAIQATVMASARGWKSVYVDTESTFRPERVEQMAQSRGIEAKEALKSIYSIRAGDVAAQSQVLERMADDPRVSSAKLVVVDTVTKNFTLEFPGKERTGRRQGALGAYLNRIAIDAYLKRRVVLLTNRVVSITVDGGSRDVNVGGLTLGRFVDKSIRLRRGGGYVDAVLEHPRTAGPPTRFRISEKGIE
ncbi:MAG TPA: ATPase domain-containing protein [Nitrososphaerales archaeon]|nr:ATPase domain-containing protein [Nitrososphaerales archaeon]